MDPADEIRYGLLRSVKVHSNQNKSVLEYNTINKPYSLPLVTIGEIKHLITQTKIKFYSSRTVFNWCSKPALWLAESLLVTIWLAESPWAPTSFDINLKASLSDIAATKLKAGELRFYFSVLFPDLKYFLDFDHWRAIDYILLGSDYIISVIHIHVNSREVSISIDTTVDRYDGLRFHWETGLNFILWFCLSLRREFGNRCQVCQLWAWIKLSCIKIELIGKMVNWGIFRDE